ncbi:MAG: ABC transporter ATP-binding protein [Flavobacteriaceae bacterium]|jgi:lipoprotein-releasing system ATP-binding protein
MVLKASHVYKTKQNVRILEDISLTVSAAEIVAITGPSGAGKSTLLQILGTLEPPDSRENTSILLEDHSLLGLSDSALAQLRNRSIGFIFQHHGLLSEFNALENVMLPGLIAKKPQKEIKEQAHYLLERLGLSHRLTHKPQALSGGEQQRVAVARALINNPKLVLADEPSGNLDSPNAYQLHELFYELVESLNCAFVVVTHNEELASKAHRILKLRDGRMVD